MSRKSLINYLLATSLFLLLGCQSANQRVGVTVKVERVVSGNTIEIIMQSGASNLIEKVRLIGIAAPDLKQDPWGVAAKKKLEELVGEKGGKVLLESDVETKDNFERRLAYLWDNGILINEKLVEQGYVLAEVLPPNLKYKKPLLRAEEYARLMGYGIWNPTAPMRLTPKEFREQQK
ncbi:MAG: thermonuclease family protein [Gomphosphaeria aponina SAG 52.96 = DSM 107014]|uniref:Thermonuclease family protein n=1 Tax=Gomphosphaeria aponina SAG 52.96 = DSM 107014 TaxID=1521640 RepID=A0A941GQH7_9CHRO|nr:thermonuclease family protein [Gomphosphaeria aponina SAG 52.96 = DSM 107014]